MVSPAQVLWVPGKCLRCSRSDGAGVGIALGPFVDPKWTFAYSRLCWCSKGRSQAERMIRLAVELGLEGDSRYFAKTGLSKAGAAMAGDRGEERLQVPPAWLPGGIGVQEGCNRARGQILLLATGLRGWCWTWPCIQLRAKPESCSGSRCRAVTAGGERERLVWTWCEGKLSHFESKKLQGRSWVLPDAKGIAFCRECAELSASPDRYRHACAGRGPPTLLPVRTPSTTVYF